MYAVVSERVFPFLRTLGGDDSTYAQHLGDARFTIPRSLLAGWSTCSTTRPSPGPTATRAATSVICDPVAHGPSSAAGMTAMPSLRR